MNLWNRIEKALGQGLDASREVLDKAREGAKDLSEKGVLKFDVMQLERQSMKVLSRLGQEVYDAFSVRNQMSVARDTVGVKELVAELGDIERRIEEKESALAQLASHDEKAGSANGGSGTQNSR